MARTNFWNMVSDLVVPASSEEGQKAIASEMRAYDSLSEQERKAIGEADYNLFPDEVRQRGAAWALTLDMRGTLKYRQDLEAGRFNSSPEEAARIRQDILAASKVRRSSNRVQIRRRQREERRYRMAAARAKRPE